MSDINDGMDKLMRFKLKPRLLCFLLAMVFGYGNPVNLSAGEIQDGFDLSTNKVILSFNGEALVPKKLELTKLDSSVFFTNQSENKFVELEIDFSGKKVHCHSDNLTHQNSKIKTKKPIKPGDFELVCFPSAGKYFYTVKDIASNGLTYRGEIHVHGE